MFVLVNDMLVWPVVIIYIIKKKQWSLVNRCDHQGMCKNSWFTVSQSQVGRYVDKLSFFFFPKDSIIYIFVVKMLKYARNRENIFFLKILI
jgi:hypothetical protein